MGIREAIKKGFSVAQKNGSLIILLFVFSFVFNLINVFLTPANPAPNTPPPPALIASAAFFIFLSIYFQSGSMGFVRDLLKNGSATLANFKAAAGRYYLRLLVLGIVVSLIIGVFMLLAALAVGFLRDKLAVLGVILAILFGALGIYFVVLLFLSPYSVVADDKKTGEAIKLSTKLVKKNVLPLLGISLLLVLIGFGIGLALGGILAGTSFVVKNETATQIVFALLSSLVNSYLGVVVTAAFMSFYLSLPDRS